LAHEGEYGLVTRLSREIGVSRQTLTIWREWGRRMLTRGAASTPEVTTASRERSLLTLLVSGHTSYRGIQICLAELLGWRISLGSIAREVRLAGERADAVLAELAPPGPVVLAVDECFGGLPRQGYLSAVDARSGAVWGVRGPVVPDGAVWQGVLEEVAAHGVRWTGAVHDGGKSAAAGIAAVTPAATRQRDIWHVLHRCAQTQARLERVIRKAEANWESAERYVAAVAMGKRPRYRPPAVPADAQAAAVDALVQTAADLGYLSTISWRSWWWSMVGSSMWQPADRRWRPCWCSWPSWPRTRRPQPSRNWWHCRERWLRQPTVSSSSPPCSIPSIVISRRSWVNQASRWWGGRGTDGRSWAMATS
jgi:hypothetical protein